MKTKRTTAAHLGIIVVTAILCASVSTAANAQSASTPLASAQQALRDETPSTAPAVVTREHYVKTSSRSSVVQDSPPRKGVHVSTFRAVMLFVCVALLAI